MKSFCVTSKHILIDFYGVQPLKSSQLETLLKYAAKIGKANVLSFFSHPFEGGGETAVAVLSESHITVHTWPEHNFAAFDIFMCGNTDPEAAANWLRQNITSEVADTKILVRGSNY